MPLKTRGTGQIPRSPPPKAGPECRYRKNKMFCCANFEFNRYTFTARSANCLEVFGRAKTSRTSIVFFLTEENQRVLRKNRFRAPLFVNERTLNFPMIYETRSVTTSRVVEMVDTDSCS